MKLKHIAGRDGFTLLEMMIAIVIAGILAAVAIPSYNGYMARTHQSEAKLALSGIFQAERMFSVANSTFSLCLNEMGVDTAAPGKTAHFYAVGFNVANVNPLAGCGPAAGTDCRTATYVSDPASGGRIAQLPIVAGKNFCTSTNASPNSDIAYDATVSGGGGVIATFANLSDPSIVGTYLSNATFKALAVGTVSGSGVMDKWLIDETGVVKNIVSGL